MSLLNLTLSSALASDIGWTLVHFLWQGAVLALVLEAILPLCRSASARHNWALAALAAMVAAPIITFAVLHHASANAPVPALTDSVAAMAVAQAAAPAAIPVPWTGWLVALWLAGIALLSMRALGGLMLTQSLRRGSFALPDDLLRRCRALQARLGLRAAVRFAQTRAVTVPMVVGWLRPLILIPVAAIAGLPPQQLDALILHELAHISRLDAFTNLFLMLAETVLFYHPAIWWVSRRIRIEREHCCDDVAVAQSGDVTTYVEALTALEMGRALPAFALSARGGLLKARVARLLEAPQVRRSPAAATGLVLSGLVAAAIVLPALAQPKPVQPKQGTDTTITLTRDADAQKPLFMDADNIWHRAAPGTSNPAGSTTLSGHVRLKKGDLEIHADSGRVEGPDNKPQKITLDGNVVMSGTGKIVRADHAVLNLTEHNFSVKLSPIATELGANSEDSLKLAGPTSAFGVTTDQGTVLIQVDVQKLAANGLTLAALPGVITRHGRLRSIDDIAHIVVAYKDGSPVFVASVANLAYEGAPDAEPARQHAEAAHDAIQTADASGAPAPDGITEDQLKQRIEFFEASTNNFVPSEAQLAAVRDQVKAQLETERAELAEAQRQHVTVSKAEVESSIKNVLAAQHLSEAQMQAALAKTGATMDAMRAKLIAQLAWAKVVAADAAAQHPGQTVDPAEMTRIAAEALARAKAQAMHANVSDALQPAAPPAPPAPASSHTDNRPARRDMASIPATANDGASTNEQDRQVFPANAAKPPAQRVTLVDGQQEMELEQLKQAQRQHVIISPPDVDRPMLKTVPHPKVDSWIQPIARPAPAASPAPLPRPTGFIPVAQSAAKIQPIMESHTLPPYPEISSRLGEHGTVVMNVTIGKDGHVAHDSLAHTSGSNRLDQAALDYVRAHWLWAPPTRNGKPVATNTRISVVFDLGAPEPQPAMP